MNDATADTGEGDFVRRSESLSRALRDLLTDVPDVGPAEQAAHIQQVTDRLTEDWQAPDAEPRTERCVGCGEPTDQPEVIRLIEQSSGPAVALHACPGCAPRYAA